MARFCPDRSILAGMDTAGLQAQLTALQTAYVQLSAGQRVVTVSYAQAGNNKSVTYAQTDIATLTQTIKQLQAQLGIVDRPRRAFPVSF